VRERKNCRENQEKWRNFCVQIQHAERMENSPEPKSPSRVVAVSIVVSLLSAWGGVVYLAVIVSRTTLQMLEYVTKLAQLY
jgi:hypothetical protein